MDDLASLNAEELKNKGNEAFKNKQYHKAIGLYSESLAKKFDHIVLSNRSQAFLKIEYYEAAMSDASESIRIEPTAKAYYRRATALHNLGFHSKAREDLKQALNLNPNNSEASMFLDRILITHDRPIIPLKLLEKKQYVQSKQPLKEIKIIDIGEDSNKENKLKEQSISPVDSGVSSTVEASFLSEMDSLPSPAQTSMDLVVALSQLKISPQKTVEYFETLDISKFSNIFEAGIEPEFVEFLLTGITNAPKNVEFLQKLLEISKYDLFDTSLMFCPDNLKNDLKNYLLTISSEYSNIIDEICCAYQLTLN